MTGRFLMKRLTGDTKPAVGGRVVEGPRDLVVDMAERKDGRHGVGDLLGVAERLRADVGFPGLLQPGMRVSPTDFIT